MMPLSVILVRNIAVI